MGLEFPSFVPKPKTVSQSEGRKYETTFFKCGSSSKTGNGVCAASGRLLIHLILCFKLGGTAYFFGYPANSQKSDLFLHWHIDRCLSTDSIFGSPKGCHSLVLRVKLDTALSVKVQVSLNGSSRAGKRKHWQWNWNWYIDTVVIGEYYPT